MNATINLNAELNQVKNSRASQADKKRAIIKILGKVRDAKGAEVEADRLLWAWGLESRQAAPRAWRSAIKYTFGIELEVVGVTSTTRMVEAASAAGIEARYETYNHTDNKRYFKMVPDGSLLGEGAIECVSPVLKEGRAGYNTAKACCQALRQAGAYVNRSTGYHVHVGGQITDTQYVNVFKNYQKLEAVIDRFMAPSRRDCRWAQALARYDFSACTCPRDVYGKLRSRYMAVNPDAWSRHHTIEFRQHAGTVNPDKVVMWATFCIKLVAWSRDHAFDCAPASIDEVPFLTAKEKAYFKSRAQEIAARGV